MRLEAIPVHDGDVALLEVRMTWRSLSPVIATVDPTGLVTGRDSGDAQIVVTAHGRAAVEDTIVARVRWVPRTIVLSAAPDSLIVRRAGARVSAALLDGRGAPVGGRITWSSSDTTVARVDSTGQAWGMNTGTAWIRAVAETVSDSVLLRADFGRELPGFTSLRTISAGGAQINGTGVPSVCALDVAGAAYCWHGNANTRGGGPSPASIARTAVSGGITFRKVAVGNNHVCGIATDSALYCWGWNTAGAFGNASTTGSSDVPVAAAQGLRFIDIDGGGHTGNCGIAAADSVVYCWGLDDRAQMGRGFVPSSPAPLAPVVGAVKATQVDLGFHHACAIGVDRATWCWGEVDNFDIGSTEDRFTVPRIAAPAGTFVSIVAGAENTCGLAADGRASCFGYVGGTDTDVPVPVGGDLRFARLFTAYVSEMCGLTLEGALYCWDSYTLPVEPPRRLMPGRRFESAGVGPFGSFAITVTGEIYGF